MKKELHEFSTQRLCIKKTSLIDAPFMLNLMNTPKYLKYIGDRKITSIALAESFINTKIIEPFKVYGYSNYTVFNKETNNKMGVCGLYHRDGVQGVDLGFGFLPEYEKKGYAFEAASALLKIAEDKLHLKVINAITHLENEASKKLLLKLGFNYISNIKLPNDKEEVALFTLVFNNT